MLKNKFYHSELFACFVRRSQSPVEKKDWGVGFLASVMCRSTMCRDNSLFILFVLDIRKIL
jgi:hypothetical protein